MSKDSNVVDCSEAEKSLDRFSRCVAAIDALDSDCLPRLSQRREQQLDDGKTGKEKCKEILVYKKDNKLCK